MLRTTTLISALVAVALPGAAGAAVFPGETIDGPSGDLVSVGGVDVSRDGTGAVAYVKRDGGVPHVFVSRLIDGAFGAPERVDGSIGDAASQPVVAAGESGRLLVAWVAGGGVLASVRPNAGTAYAPPQALGTGRNPAVDVSSNGHGYVVWSTGSDVRAARLERVGGPGLGVVDAPLDVDPAREAGATDATRPDVAVSADGVAVAAWGEAGHVYARRLFGTTVSQAPLEVGVESFEGAAGGDADAPDVDIEDDSSFAQIVFRQRFGDTTRALGRRIRGGAIDPPQAIDGGSGGVDRPRLDMSGTGLGLTATGLIGSGQVLASNLEDDAFGRGARIDSTGSGVASQPVPAFAQNGDGLVAWLTGSAPPAGAPTGPIGLGAATPPQASSPDAQLRGRLFDNGAAGGEVGLSKPELGPVDSAAGISASADRLDDVALVAMQGTGSDRRLVAAMADRPPSQFVGYTTQSYRRFALPPLTWQQVIDVWGGALYTVIVDGKVVGQTREAKLTPKTPIPDGQHRWRVVALDRRGQTTSTPLRLLSIDATPPVAAVSVSGARRAGSLVTVAASASDHTSGVKRVRIDFGDGSKVVEARRAVHRYASKGTYTVRVTAADAARNTTVAQRTVRVAGKAKKGKKKG